MQKLTQKLAYTGSTLIRPNGIELEPVYKYLAGRFLRGVFCERVQKHDRIWASLA